MIISTNFIHYFIYIVNMIILTMKIIFTEKSNLTEEKENGAFAVNDKSFEIFVSLSVAFIPSYFYFHGLYSSVKCISIFYLRNNYSSDFFWLLFFLLTHISYVIIYSTNYKIFDLSKSIVKSEVEHGDSRESPVMLAFHFQ